MASLAALVLFVGIIMMFVGMVTDRENWILIGGIILLLAITGAAIFLAGMATGFLP